MFEIRPLRSVRLPALFGAGALIIAACSSAATPTPTAPPVATPTTAPVATAGATPTGVTGGTTITINMATSATVGPYLTGPDGKTLYVKAGDAATAATTCTGSCIANWPPLTVTAGQQVVAGAGVTGTLSTFVRPEGMTQVTYNGKPLYNWQGDSAAGDTTGQGIGGFTVAAP